MSAVTVFALWPVARWWSRGLWSSDAVERQMSHQERKRVRAAYIHKAQHLEERREMMQWWADYLDANRFRHVVPYGFKNRREAHSTI